MRKIDAIVIHCSDTFPEMDIGVAEIRQWHLNRNWKDIGYHYCIRRNGHVEPGRPVEQQGAHCRGHNSTSLGVCLVGGKSRAGEQACNFTYLQWIALSDLVIELCDQHDIVKVLGHNQIANKSCPSFDVPAWRADLGD